MKYDISGLEKDKIIDHYRIIKKKNNRYNIFLYYRKGTGKAFNYPYEDMIDLKETIDIKMLEQLKLLVENDDIAEETFSNKGAQEAKMFAKIGNIISFLGPLILSIIFANPINLILVPIFLKITNVYKGQSVLNVIDDEYDNYKKYCMCVELENEFNAVKEKYIDINNIDNYNIRELEKLKSILLFKREVNTLSHQLFEQEEKEKKLFKKR